MELNRQEQNLNNELKTQMSTKLASNLGLGLTQNIQNFLEQLAERLEKMEEVLVIDRIEGNIAVCENRKTGKMQDIQVSELPENIQEGTILKWKSGKYEIDTSEEIEQRINQKMKDVWK